MNEQLIRASEFARRMKVSPAAVSKAIKTGRITPVENPGKSGVWLDPKVAAQEWAKNSRFRIEAGGNQNLQSNKAKIVTLSSKKQRNQEAPQATDDIEDDTPPILDSRAKLEKYNAELAKLKYETSIGKLVSAEDVLYEWKRVILSTRSHFLAIPAKIKTRLPELTAEQLEAIEELIREALEEMSGDRNDNA